ncbi:NADP-dependent phosphogluconate dehydrogenase [archaeon]|nr:MAG: NADP-dependent phosphogluconate dehydrogenase [archaeon]
MSADFGVVGLAVMGQNLTLNVESRGYTAAVYNRTASKTKEFVSGTATGKKIIPSYSLPEFVASLAEPRKIILMVKAGGSTDAVLEQLFPLLSAHDIVLDGGNAHYSDTERRIELAKEYDLRYLGVGISGGEEGALHGPAIMAGGDPDGYKQVEEILTRIAGVGPEGPCCAYFGPGSSGHYVKMVHNGIEYAIMETIAEAYDLMSRGLGMAAPQMADLFGEWNNGELSSYLFEISEEILRRVDPETGNPLVEAILDEAAQKGTGKWSTQSALDMGSPTPTIAMSVFARVISALKEERVRAHDVLSGPDVLIDADRTQFLRDLFGAVQITVLSAYAQGFRQLQDASRERGYNLNLAEVARVWMAGCIIRARSLAQMAKAFRDDPELPLLFLVGPFKAAWEEGQAGLRRVLRQAHSHGIPTPTIDSAIDFVDGYRSARLPANMIQAQRDFFGAHTYKRIDREGTFHTEWEEG